jgi:hypothetical protein
MRWRSAFFMLICREFFGEEKMKSSMNFAALFGAAMLALAGCSDDPVVADTTPTGNGVCLQLSAIDHTEIRDDQTILFFMKGGKVWKNTLTFSCPALKLEGGFKYETDTQQICSELQTIHVVNSGGLCELGQFTPYVAYAPPKP